MIERTVGIESEETVGRMAIATFLRSLDVGRGLADGDGAIMAITAATKDFRVINKSCGNKSCWSMTGLTQITCCNVSARLGLK